MLLASSLPVSTIEDILGLDSTKDSNGEVVFVSAPISWLKTKTELHSTPVRSMLPELLSALLLSLFSELGLQLRASSTASSLILPGCILKSVWPLILIQPKALSNLTNSCRRFALVLDSFFSSLADEDAVEN